MTVFGARLHGDRLPADRGAVLAAAGRHRLDLPGLPGGYGVGVRRRDGWSAGSGRRGALYLAGGTTAAGLLLSLADSLPLVLLGLVLITAGFFAGHAVASSAVSQTATEGRAQASALYQSAYYMGSSAGSTLGAVAFHAGGWAGTVVVGAAGGAGRRGDHRGGAPHAARRGRRQTRRAGRT